MVKNSHSNALTTTLSILSPLSLLVIWEICARFSLIDTRLLSSPTQIFHSLVPLVASGELVYNTYISV